MRTNVVGDESLIVVDIRFTAVPFVAHGEHPVGQHGEFEQRKCPVALVLLGRQILQLTAQRQFFVHFILALRHENVAVNHSAFALDDGLVVALVHIHQIQLEIAAQTLVDLDVQVLIIGFVAPFPEGRAVAVGACAREELAGENFSGSWTLVDGVDVREIDFHARAVFAAESRVFFERIAQFRLIRPLAAGMGGVGIGCSERVGVIHREGWQMVQERRSAVHRPARAKRHVVRAFRLQQKAQSTLRIRGRKHRNIAFSIDIAIVKRWVLRLLRIFGEKVPSAVRHTRPHIPRIHVFRQV